LIGKTLRDIRKACGLSQETLAEKCSTFQANISEIERDQTSPSVETAQLLFSKLGYRLIVVPIQGLTVQEWGSEIEDSLKKGNEKKAFRIFLQLNDDLTSREPGTLQIIAATPPVISDPKYSALISGLIEWHFTNRQLPLPSWLVKRREILGSPWFVDQLSPNKARIRKSTPRAFAKRNVFLRESELISL
jgi:transcriptional regulator with XRE-family HTH domain